MSNRREILSRVRRVVVKVGSAVVTDETGLSRPVLENLAAEISRFQRQGYEMILVSSGAIACGRKKLEVPERPLSLAEKQALAAAGQSSLMQAYEEAFGRYGVPVAQVLLIREDLEDRRRYLNARNTLRVLLRWRVVPIVNENDTVAVEEIQFGDNDFLAALVVALTEADLLICLSEADALYERDPREDPSARPVREVRGITPEIEAMAGKRPGRFGRGGMLSKLRAARMVNSLGVPMILAHGRTPLILERLFSGEELGTLFLPSTRRLSARKFWIAHGAKPEGRLVLDAGAVVAIRERGRSLLPAGIRAVEGEFDRGACVECVDEKGRPVALGLTNYSSEELRCILGAHTCEIEERLGFRTREEVIHRDDLVLVEN
ncbi:glutamate 5-kinase [Thermosulfurimonas marina]|uniref:Glutamate 5-kinase n=1 Tax=Thermosulfurimonas marina TaxID=2047767 RepID=A0A6H1WSY1_9BACT|nr:glutamate 5-kinase [Thermosulfurimonas marina]QJA06327.1 glutamate 5-kinase [Thermosulfurimonas marina]